MSCCPTCNSPAPSLHPEPIEGTVILCPNPWHQSEDISRPAVEVTVHMTVPAVSVMEEIEPLYVAVATDDGRKWTWVSGKLTEITQEESNVPSENA